MENIQLIFILLILGLLSCRQKNSEFELTFSIDGRTTYFSRRAPENKQKIYVSHLKALAIKNNQ